MSIRRLDRQAYFNAGQRGTLTAYELPFDAKRVYWITDVGDIYQRRGGHAHRALHQSIFMVAGACRVKVPGDGAPYYLDYRGTGLYLPPMTWRELDMFTTDAVMLVAASEHFDDSDYIHDWQEFCDELRRDAR